MNFFKIAAAFAVFIGLAIAGACGPDGSCPSGYHCNEFKRCIAGSPKSKSVHNGACKPDGSCPAGQHCHKLKRCIDSASFKGDSVKCTTSADCNADHHCNEFHVCIPGTPRTNQIPWSIPCDSQGRCTGIYRGFRCEKKTNRCVVDSLGQINNA